MANYIGGGETISLSNLYDPIQPTMPYIGIVCFPDEVFSGESNTLNGDQRSEFPYNSCVEVQNIWLNCEIVPCFSCQSTMGIPQVLVPMVWLKLWVLRGELRVHCEVLFFSVLTEVQRKKRRVVEEQEIGTLVGRRCLWLVSSACYQVLAVCHYCMSEVQGSCSKFQLCYPLCAS